MNEGAVPVLPAFDCAGECRLAALVRDGQFLALEGEDAAPPCPACLEEARRATGPDRLTAPLRARGVQRGAEARGDMEEAPWDEVLERLAYLLAEAARGQRRVLWITAGPRPRLSHALARRVGAFVQGTTIVRRVPPAETAAQLLAAAVHPDERGAVDATADVVLAWGADPAGGDWRTWLQVLAATEAGARLLVVDPRSSATARAAAVHLPLRPGTDAALALGLAHLVHGRHAQGYAPAPGPARAARGADIPGPLASALAAWSPARAADVCGVPVEALQAVASALVGARAPRLLVGGGVARHAESAPAVHALALLARLAGARVAEPDPAPDPAEAAAKPIGGEGREIPSGALEAELRTRDPRRDLVVIERGHPLADLPSSGALRAYLQQAAFVVAFQDRFGPVAAAADLVLPVPSFLERSDLEGTRRPAGVRAGAAALAPRRDARPETAILRAVARRLGWAGAWFPAELLEYLGDGTGAARVPQRVGAGAGRWEPPVYREPSEGPRSSPDVFRAFRLFLVTGRPGPGARAGDAGAGAVRGAGTGAGAGAPRVLLAETDAAARGIRDGDRVVVHNDRGRVRAVAALDPGAVPGAVVVPEGWDWPVGAAAASELAPPARGPATAGGEVPGPCLVEVNRV